MHDDLRQEHGAPASQHHDKPDPPNNAPPGLGPASDQQDLRPIASHRRVVRHQAQRLGAGLRAAGVPVKVFGARETNHSRINTELGLPQDPCTRELWAFVDAHREAGR